MIWEREAVDRNTVDKQLAQNIVFDKPTNQQTYSNI